MKFSIQKETLQNILLEQNKVIPIRTTLPVLSCALFEIKKNKLIIHTTDLDQTIISETKIKDEEEGGVAIPISKLTEIVSALPTGEIKITSNEDFLVEINNSQGTYKITGKNPEDYPEKNTVEKTESLILKGKELLDIIRKTT